MTHTDPRYEREAKVSVPRWLPESLVNERQHGFIEGYAAACEDIRRELTGDGGSAKSYDPLRIVAGVAHSYAFELRDGGRHHPLNQYEGMSEILTLLLSEALAWIHEVNDDELREVHAALIASAGEAGTAETGNTDSAEGEHATAESRDAQPPPQPPDRRKQK